MGTAAQLDRIGAVQILPHRQHPDFLAVFLAKQRHGTRGNRILGRHQPRCHRIIRPDLGIHIGFNQRNLGGAHRFLVGEIEAQPVGRDQRPLLRHMPAEPLAQRLMQQMGGAVIGTNLGAPCCINR